MFAVTRPHVAFLRPIPAVIIQTFLQQGNMRLVTAPWRLGWCKDGWSGHWPAWKIDGTLRGRADKIALDGWLGGTRVGVLQGPS